MKEREIIGVKVFVSGETYNEYKGTLEEQLEEKDKEIENLKENWKELKEIIQDQINNPLNVEMKIFSKMVLNDMETIERIERR